MFINGESTKFIEQFEYDPASGKLASKRSELEEAGVRTPPGPADALVPLESLGRPYRFDETTQRIDFTLSDEQRLARDYDARFLPAPIKPQADPGFLFNYSVFGGNLQASNLLRGGFNGANLSFDARAFSNYGVLSQTGIVGATLYSNSNLLRLETTYTFGLPDKALTGRVGDVISGGLNWTRPIRMGGVQAQRDFTMRPDIVTRPMPVIAGSAAAPSTVDVFINGVRSYSQDVGSGPYRITNLPLLAGSGDARIVTRDVTGREAETTMLFSNPARMLAPGIYDFSVEAGFARRDFGIAADDYDKRPLASATLRRGFTPWLTLEGHLEGGAGLANGGAGAIVNFGRFGALSGAAAVSHSHNGAGYKLYGGWDAQFSWLSVNISTNRTFLRFDDLASVTARYTPQNTTFIPGGPPLPTLPAFNSTRPPRALDVFSLTAPAPWLKGNISLGFIHARQEGGQRNRIATLSYAVPGPLRSNFFFAGFADLAGSRNRGVYAGLNIPLWGQVQANIGAGWSPDSKLAGSLEIVKPQPLLDNTYGFRLRDAEGANAYRVASGSFRSPYGQIGAQAQQFAGRTDVSGTLDGSIAVMGGGVFVGNKVTSGFAVVDAGRPDVPVLQDNREIGRTNMFGKKLVTDVRPWERNNIGIDPSALPPDYDLATTNKAVAPAGRAGVVVDFSKAASGASALVVLYGADGKHLPVGAQGRLNGGGEPFVVGYDGQAYIRGLRASNSVTIDTSKGACSAQFAYQPQGGAQVFIDRVVCR